MFSSNRKKKFLGLVTRCKDEYFVKEFCDYYLSQGVDQIVIVDDDSNDKSIYNELKRYENIEIDFQKNIIETEYIGKIYPSLKKRFHWLIYVDVDEFITTKRNSHLTIREELENTFESVDCIKVPWVMMSSNNLDKSPSSILLSNIYRWDHDKRHPHDIHKFRCRYDEIEVKCIFKTKSFVQIRDHHPVARFKGRLNIVESVNAQTTELDPWYHSLREKDISSGYLLCYHYRIISKENSNYKLVNNYWYKKHGYTLDDLMSCDYSERVDMTLAEKVSG